MVRDAGVVLTFGRDLWTREKQRTVCRQVRCIPVLLFQAFLAADMKIAENISYLVPD